MSVPNGLMAEVDRYQAVYFCRMRMTRYDQLLRDAEALWKKEREGQP